jgi:WD domain, G-beta repeat
VCSQNRICNARTDRRLLDRLVNRHTKITSETRKLGYGPKKTAEIGRLCPSFILNLPLGWFSEYFANATHIECEEGERCRCRLRRSDFRDGTGQRFAIQIGGHRWACFGAATRPRFARFRVMVYSRDTGTNPLTVQQRFQISWCVLLAAVVSCLVCPAAQGASAELKVQLGHSDAVTSVAFSPDGRSALTGSWDNTARLWELSSGREIRRFEGHSGYVSSVAFSPDGRSILTGSWDKTARLWDVSSGQEIRRFWG